MFKIEPLLCLTLYTVHFVLVHPMEISSLSSLLQMRKVVQRQSNFSKITHLVSGSQDVEPRVLLDWVTSSALAVLTNMLDTKSNP